MADLFDNPMGLAGFEFVEFTAPEKGIIEPVFEAIGMTRIAKHRSKDVHLRVRSQQPCCAPHSSWRPVRH